MRNLYLSKFSPFHLTSFVIFIFCRFLKRKRDKLKKAQSAKKEMERDVGSDVSDDEFDAYLDTLGAASDLDKTEKDFDYLSELQPSEISKQDKKKKKKAGAESDDEPELDWDEGSDVGSESGGSVDEESVIKIDFKGYLGINSFLILGRRLRWHGRIFIFG